MIGTRKKSLFFRQGADRSFLCSENLSAHKLITRKVRKRPWLRAQLLEKQKEHPERFRDKAGRFRPLTVKRHVSTRCERARL